MQRLDILSARPDGYLYIQELLSLSKCISFFPGRTQNLLVDLSGRSNIIRVSASMALWLHPIRLLKHYI